MNFSKRNPIALAILAGGKSKRFGGEDKQCIRFRGQPLGRVAAQNALSMGRRVFVVGNNISPYKGLDIDILPDLRPGFGPLSGLHAALSCCDADWVYLMACDTPFFEGAWFEYLAERSIRAEELVICAKTGGHFEPFHALYSRSLIKFLDSLFDEPLMAQRSFSFRALLTSVPCMTVPEETVRRFSPDWMLFKGANNYEELASMEKSGTPIEVSSRI
jgi:molybdopterin-guanine dinucleotide biosynthesis protein A